MRVILPPPRSFHRAGGGGGNNSDYSQGRDYFNAENKNTNASWRGFWFINLPYVDSFLSDKNTPCYSLLEDCFFNGKKNLYYNPLFFFCEKIYIQIHIQTCLYTYMRINIYSNKFIYSQTQEFRVCSPSRGQRWSAVCIYKYTSCNFK